MLKDLRKIIAWQDLISIILILFFIKISFLESFAFETSLTYYGLFILIIACTFIVSAGSFINYYYKKVKDLTFFSKKQLLYAYFILASAGVLLGSYISLNIDKPFFILVFFFATVSTVWFAKNSYPKTILNNIFPSFIKSSSFILIWWMDSPISLNMVQWEIFLKIEVLIIYFIAISFIGNFIRSVIIDLKNFKFNRKKNEETLPVVFGEKAAKKIIIVMAYSVTFLTLALILYLRKSIFSALVIFIFMIVPQTLCIRKLIKSKTEKDYSKLIKGLSIILLLGVLAIPLISYFIKDVIL
ncbi:hypothetical protein [Tenacibaculum sp. IB213877]|uniref:hypothetical protein n=1 Tax=Tenacibaculum sp. IB213877 TaxID=3097351 RepID=UPI002A59B247|nr:hypothetical protein [Tenacibaculum sp. IB213877]MDY0779583.1 hypothetical protein [Tenacibaculum sp. IB213877]